MTDKISGAENGGLENDRQETDTRHKWILLMTNRSTHDSFCYGPDARKKSRTIVLQYQKKEVSLNKMANKIRRYFTDLNKNLEKQKQSLCRSLKISRGSYGGLFSSFI